MTQETDSSTITIRTFDERDWPRTWDIIRPVLRAGETYAYPPEITEADAHQVWIDLPRATYVAVSDNQTYINDTIGLRVVRVKLNLHGQQAGDELPAVALYQLDMSGRA